MDFCWKTLIARCHELDYRMPYSYTNRQSKTHYFRAVQTKKGSYRYYVTQSEEYPDLIEEVPKGFEVTELPEEAKVVIRKIRPVLTTKEEKEIVFDAIKELSAIKDFFVHADADYLSVYHSQFSSTGGQEKSLSRDEVIEHFGKGIERSMPFLTSLRFRLIDKEKRLFQTERIVFLGIFDSSFLPVGQLERIEDVARKYGQHLGRNSFFNIIPHGFEE